MWRWKGKEIKDMDAKKISKNSAAYLTLGLAILAMTFFGVCDPDSGVRSLTGAAAKVDDEVVTSMDFRRTYTSELDRYQQRDPEGVEAGKYNISQNVIDNLVNDRIFYKKTKDLGLFVGENEVVDYILNSDGFKNDKGSFDQKNFDNYLKYQRYSENDFQELVKRELAREKFTQFINQTYQSSDSEAEINYALSESKLKLDFVKIDDTNVNIVLEKKDIDAFLTEEGKGKVKSYYDSHKDDYETERKIKARHILISFKGARNASGAAKDRTKDQAKAKAAEVLGKAKASGSNFAELAKTYTDEPVGKTKGGDLGYFTKDAMVKEFSAVAFKLPANTISDVVESPFGFHIIKVEGSKPAKNVTLENATEEIVKILIKKDTISDVVQKTAEKVLKDIQESKPLDKRFKWEETGEFSITSRYIPKIGVEKGILDSALSLSKPSEVHGKVLDVRGKKYIIRLKDIKIADFEKLDAEGKKEWLGNSATFASYTLIRKYNADFKKEFEKSGKIWINDEYRNWDQNLKRRQAEEGS